MRSILSRKLHSIGWAVSHVAVTRNDVSFSNTSLIYYTVRLLCPAVETCVQL